MYKYQILSVVFFIFTINLIAQKRPIKVVDEKVSNRLDLYAINENLIDYDIIVTVKGTGFRQKTGKQRKIRIPATSKVKVNSLVIERGKTPQYIYTVKANDSLSRRAMRPTATKIKIDPSKVFIIYSSIKCVSCDSLMSSLDKSIYNYKKINLSENKEISDTLEKYVPSIDTITTPIINIGGYIYTDIITVDKVIEKLEK